jgi:septum formation protein
MTFERLNKYQFILASTSPRRQYLLKELGLKFTVKTKEAEEIYPNHLQGKDIALYLAELKANAFEKNEIPENTIVIAADTIVCLKNEVLTKPIDYKDAFKIISSLSAKKHEVISGVCFRSVKKTISFHASTDVYFKKLSEDEIHHYIEHYKPYDKAGAYGIQEWIGYIGIERINGSFYNVMGLPVQRVYEEILKF